MFRRWCVFFVAALVLISLQEAVAQRNGKYAKDLFSDHTPKPQGKGVGISAWGLVFLILSVILIGVSAYYFIIFYPILCKKERKYDRIELTTV